MATRSYLQKLSSKVTWITKWKLQPVYYREIDVLNSSRTTWELVAAYNNIQQELIKSIKKDYETNKLAILQNRDKTKGE